MATFNYTTQTRTILADLYTPVGVYMRLRDIYPQSALMESSDYHGTENSRSFIGVHPIASIAVGHGVVTATYPDGRVEEKELPAFGEGKGEKCKLAISKAFNDFIQAFHVEGRAVSAAVCMVSQPLMPCATSRTFPCWIRRWRRTMHRIYIILCIRISSSSTISTTPCNSSPSVRRQSSMRS